MTSIWKTISAGAFSLLLSCTPLTPLNTSYTQKPKPTPTSPKRTCPGVDYGERLETIIEREAAGIPSDYAKASQEIVDKLDPNKLRYECTIVTNDVSGNFNPLKSYDIFTLIRNKGWVPDEFVDLLIKLSENNMSRGHPKLSDSLVKYIIKANFIYSSKVHKLKINYKPSDVQISRLPPRVVMMLNRKDDLANLKYKKASLPADLFLRQKHLDTSADYVTLPLFPEAIIPYAAIKPKKVVKVEPAHPKVRKKKKKGPEFTHFAAGISFGVSYHPIVDWFTSLSLEIGYHKDKYSVGAYGSLLLERTSEASMACTPSSIEFFGGSVGVYGLIGLNKYFGFKALIGLTAEKLEVRSSDSGEVEFYKIYYAPELGAGLCGTIPSDNLKISICADYRARLMRYFDTGIEEKINEGIVYPTSHGGALTLYFSF